MRFSWPQGGETSTAFLKIHAAHRRQKNHIFHLTIDDEPVFDDIGMAQTAFQHFSSILGSHEERIQNIDLHAIGHPSFNLASLDTPFSEAEI